MFVFLTLNSGAQLLSGSVRTASAYKPWAVGCEFEPQQLTIAVNMVPSWTETDIVRMNNGYILRCEYSQGSKRMLLNEQGPYC